MGENYIHELKKNVRNAICEHITIDLTTGRERNGCQPYTQEMINIFIKNNKENIEIVIQNMFNVYEENEILNELEDYPDIAIRDFLYNIVNIPFDEFADV